MRGYSMKDGRKSDYFDTKYMTVLGIEQRATGRKTGCIVPK